MLRDPAFFRRPNNIASRGRGEGKNRSATKFRKNAPKYAIFSTVLSKIVANTAPLFSQLKVLDIFSINSFSVATFMYSYHHNLWPSSFHDLFLSSNQVHQYKTRLAPQNRPHFFRTNIKQFQPPPHALPFSQGRGERLVMSRKGPWEGYRPQDLPDVSPDVKI